MNVEFKNIKDNEWITTNEEGRMRFVKAQAESTEMADILNKEDELEILEETKEELLESIDKINKFMRQNKRLSISVLLVFIMTLGVFTPIFKPFSWDNAEMILSLLVWALGLGFTESCIFCKHKYEKEELTIYEERLQEIKERKPELEKEIAKLKEKYNFREEEKEVNYFENLSYENREERRLVRARTRK